MNKPVAAIAVIAAVAVVGIPPVIGAFTEQRVMAQAERLEAMGDNAYNFGVFEYEGGWFGSTARIQARLGEEYVQQIVDTVNQEDDMAAAITAMMIQSFLGNSMPLEIELGRCCTQVPDRDPPACSWLPGNTRLSATELADPSQGSLQTVV